MEPFSEIIKILFNRHQEEQLYRTDQLQSLTKFTVINIK